MDSKRDHSTVVEVLSAYIRERTRARGAEANLAEANLAKADFTETFLVGTNLTKAKLNNAILTEARGSGSTPARVGTTAGRAVRNECTAEHPRVCGDDWQRLDGNCGSREHHCACGDDREGVGVAQVLPGAPPRVRGRLCADVSELIRALEHPRACGDDCVVQPVVAVDYGAPPRVRGRPAGRARGRGELRSTPARAGTTLADLALWTLLPLCRWVGRSVRSRRLHREVLTGPTVVVRVLVFDEALSCIRPGFCRWSPLPCGVVMTGLCGEALRLALGEGSDANAEVVGLCRRSLPESRVQERQSVVG